jgi:hypothetical protein
MGRGKGKREEGRRHSGFGNRDWEIDFRKLAVECWRVVPAFCPSSFNPVVSSLHVSPRSPRLRAESLFASPGDVQGQAAKKKGGLWPALAYPDS